MALLAWLRWLASAGAGRAEAPATVLTAVDSLPQGTQFTWEFAEAADLVEQLPTARQAQGEAFVAYFRGEIERYELERRVGSV